MTALIAIIAAMLSGFYVYLGYYGIATMTGLFSIHLAVYFAIEELK